MRAIAITVALLSTGCSFIQNWGDLRDDGFDAGRDAGRRDAGPDPMCPMFTCTGPGDCAADEECVETIPGCFECRPLGDGVPEGDSCNEDIECALGHVCPFELGICVRECGDTAECVDSVVGPFCADAFGRRICIDSECDPVYGDPCLFCVIEGVDVGSTEVVTACASGVPGLSPGAECMPGDGLCSEGHDCIQDSFGYLRCRRLCYTDEGCGDAGYERCESYRDARTGNEVFFGGRELGACMGRVDVSCVDDLECPVPGDRCVRDATGAGSCRIDCISGDECVAQGFGMCLDVDMDGRTECF